MNENKHLCPSCVVDLRWSAHEAGCVRAYTLPYVPVRTNITQPYRGASRQIGR